MNARLLLLLAASASSAAATATCPVYVQSQTTSTLTDPITKIVSSSSSASGSGGSATSSSSASGSNFSDAGSQAGTNNADVGSLSSGSGTSAGSSGASTSTTTAGSADSTGSAGVSTTPTTTTAPSSTTKTPSSTTATPTSTTATSTTTGSASATATTTTTTGPTTTAPSADTTTTATTTTSSGSTGTSAGTTTSLSLGARKLQTTTTGSTTGTTGTTTTAGSTTAGTTTTTTTTAGSSSTSGTVGSGSSSSDVLTCDSTFYSAWDTLGLTCGGASIDVASAVSASSCVIYSGSVGSTSGSTCVSICSFPACTNSAWVYGGDNGISSSVYDGLSLESFLSSDVIAALEQRSSTVSTFLSNSTMSDSQQCTYSSESSFSSCSCSAMLIDSSASGSVADAAKKQQREQDEVDGVITKDNTTTTGTVVAATSKSVAGVTVAITGIAAIASTAVGGVSSAGASLAAAGSTMAITTVEICQFGVLVNQLQLDGKSSALAQFGKAMAPAAFTFLPFGKLEDGSDSSSSGSGSTSSSSNAGRRLASSSSSGSSSSSSTDQLTGIAKYSRQLNIEEDMLFIVTLAGVFCVMACVVGLFGIGYLVSGLMMPREEYLSKFFDKMIGLEVLVAILSQYTIGVTATFQIYYSMKYESITDPKCLLAIAAIVFLAAGILVYGYIVIKKHEAEIADVGTVQHMKKTVNMRYGPLYEEYKYKNRYFFAAKMMLALTTGVVTGCASMSGTVQVSIILALNVLFFFYLEIQSPHHSKFVQTTTSFVSIMKIAVLVLTFFLVTAAASDGFPTSLQNGISVAIVGLNLFVLALLMIRSLYTFWQKFKLQRDAAYDQEEQTAQDYFKDETPAGRKASNAQQPTGQPILQSQYSNVNNTTTNDNPYVQGSNAVDYNSADEIRLRSATHEDDDRQQTYDASRRSAANHYITQVRNTYGQRRNDVVEL
ncbi:Ferredoxin-fold anticodon-binding domain-containing protein 1 [Phytophthora ramorum]